MLTATHAFERASEMVLAAERVNPKQKNPPMKAGFLQMRAAGNASLTRNSLLLALLFSTLFALL